jgi:hypothetical protein
MKSRIIVEEIDTWIDPPIGRHTHSSVSELLKLQSDIVKKLSERNVRRHIHIRRTVKWRLQ